MFLVVHCRKYLMSQKFAAKVLTFYEMGNTQFTEYLRCFLPQPYLYYKSATYDLLMIISTRKFEDYYTYSSQFLIGRHH